jgi:hypothetical protein
MKPIVGKGDLALAELPTGLKPHADVFESDRAALAATDRHLADPN